MRKKQKVKSNYNKVKKHSDKGIQKYWNKFDEVLFKAFTSKMSQH